MTEARLWTEMTVVEVGRAAKEGWVVLLPVGCVEQHGYHLPTGTDFFVAQEVARRTAKLTRCVVAAGVPYSFSGGELPGTVDVDPAVVSQYVLEVVRSFYKQGFRAVVLVLGHGGSENVAVLEQEVKVFFRRNPHFMDRVLLFVRTWELGREGPGYVRDGDYHAAFGETSLMLHIAPHLVRTERIVRDKPELAELLAKDPDAYQQETRLTDSPFEVPHISQRSDIEVGVMGDPAGASAQVGKQMVEAAAQGLAGIVRQIESALRPGQ